MPQSIVIRIPPPVPAMVAGGLNAIEIIIPKLSAILSKFEIMMILADITYINAINGAKKPVTGQYPVIFDPRVSRSIASHYASAMNG